MSQRDLIIAGALVLVTLTLVVVAFLPGKKPTPSTTFNDPVAAAPAFDTTPAADPWPAPPAAPTGIPSGPDPFAPAVTPSPAPVPLPTGPVASDPFAPVPAPSDPFAPAAVPAMPSGSFTDAPTAYAPASTSATPVASSTAARTHVIAKGELLGDISTKHYGSAKHWKAIKEANPGLDERKLKVGAEIVIPALADEAPASGQSGGGDGTYVVKKGDTYYVIAKKELGSASRWRELEKLNHIAAEDLRVGMKLKLPKQDATSTHGKAVADPTGKTIHTIAKGELLGDISKKYYGTSSKWRDIVQANPGLAPERLKPGQEIVIPNASPAGAPAGGGDGYVVKKGDTLMSIAQSQLGSAKEWKKLAAANPGVDSSNLRIGQTIKVPGGAKPADPGPTGTAPAPAPLAPFDGMPSGPTAPSGGMPTAPVPAAPAIDWRNDPFAPLPEVPATPAAPLPSRPAFP